MRSNAGRLLIVGISCLSLLVLAGCGGDKSGGPVGAPEQVVGKAPDVTLGAGTAEVIITAPTANAKGVIDLAGRSGRLSMLAPGYPQAVDLMIVAGQGYAKEPSSPAFHPLAGTLPAVFPSGDPWAAIDLIRGTVHILSDGGGEVDGASTIGYTLTVDPQQAIETTPPSRQDAVRSVLAGRASLFQMDVWIDSRLRLRRIEVPAAFAFTTVTPPTRVDGATIATDIDFVTFGVASPAVARPT